MRSGCCFRCKSKICWVPCFILSGIEHCNSTNDQNRNHTIRRFNIRMDHLTFMYKAYSFCYINHYFPNLLSPQARCGAFNELRYRPRWLSGFMAVEIQYQIQFAELHINEIESRIGQYPSRNSCSNSSFLILPM